MAAADLDSDGYLDLAVVSGVLVTGLSVLLNQGDGTFQPPQPTAHDPRSLAAADLDGDGDIDLAAACLESHQVSVLLNETTPPASPDRDRDGVPDECERLFHRGDPDGNGRIAVSDPVFLIHSLLFAGPAPGCRESADVDDDGAMNVSDAISVLFYLFLDGPPARRSRPSRPPLRAGSRGAGGPGVPVL